MKLIEKQRFSLLVAYFLDLLLGVRILQRIDFIGRGDRNDAMIHYVQTVHLLRETAHLRAKHTRKLSEK